MSHPYHGLNELREMFLKFFETKGHLRLPSFSLVPQNDKSILLINAGMTPMAAIPAAATSWTGRLHSCWR